MSNRLKYSIFFILTSAVFTLLSCSNEEDTDINRPEKDTMLNLSVSTYSGTDPLQKGEDSSFSSLALYVFNKDNGYCEYARLLTQEEISEISEFNETILVSGQTKMIYAIGNYEDPDKTFSHPITEDLSMQEIENLTVSSTNFSNDNILMIGKKEVTVDNMTTIIPVVMERLVSRLDLYFFKSQTSANEKIEVLSVELVNRIKNTNCRYQDNSMMSPVQKDNYTIDFTTNRELSLIPPTLDEVVPANAHASIYTYQNIVAGLSGDAAYLLVKIKDINDTYTFKGYITDDSQTVDKYSLKRNTVYRIIGVMNGIDDEIILNTSVLPWTVASSGIGYYPDPSDYSLTPFNNDPNATSGIIHYPYAVGGAGVNETSYASYSFTLTAPAGAVWTATLTDGNDFMFFTEGSTPGKQAVSKGIARDEAYEIKVGAKRPWNGTENSTYLYITVNGEKLKINPVVNGARKFPGTNDTDILIRQTKFE